MTRPTQLIQLTQLKKMLLVLISCHLVLALSGCSGKKDSSIEKAGSQSAVAPVLVVPKSSGKSLPKDEAQVLDKETKDEVILAVKKYNYPDITVSLAVKDAQKTIATVIQAGGKILYDPNRGHGSSIPFLIATLPPGKILDDSFISSLNLSAISVDLPGKKQVSRPTEIAREANLKNSSSNDSVPNFMPGFVPIDEIGIPELRKKSPSNGLGENTIIAVIDSGIDASHPVFQNRVIYWQDLTQETHVQLEKTPVNNSTIIFNKESIALPSLIKDNDSVQVGIIDEAFLGGQVSESDKNQGLIGLDINRNKLLNDKFLIIVGTDSATHEQIAFLDTNGNLKLDPEEINTPIIDFNHARSLERMGKKSKYSGFATFPDHTNLISYPLILNPSDNGNLVLSLGIEFDGHGTHVSGIAAGNGEQIQGAAPKAELMALKVCSEMGCPYSAILRALIDAFYNPMGYVPDVVNISIGTHQSFNENILDILMRDLSAKFGAVFIVGASNSGPGYHSLNEIGSFGPALQVGAHVSKNSLVKHYTLDPRIDLPQNGLEGFSSIGPSYTGQLKPNIVAPGSAISATPLILGGSEMMSGTSMAAPITSGAIAAMLSLSKKSSLGKEYDELRTSRAKIARDGSNTPEIARSLSNFSLAVRTAIEDSAQSLPDYTMPQQGHGLLNISAAFDKFTELLSKKAQFFELKINDNKKENSLYERANIIQRVKEIRLSLQEDGETPVSETMKLNNTPITVLLEKVEVQNTDGTVITLNRDLPFSVAIRGSEDENGVSTSIVLADRYKNAFYSVRNVDRMEAGKTYIAVFNLIQNGVRIMTLTDVVHKPILLNEPGKQVKLSGLGPEVMIVKEGYFKSNVKIRANSTHRYPIAITNRESRLKVELGFSAGFTGMLSLSVTAPNGREIDQETIAYSKNITKTGKSSDSIYIPIFSRNENNQEGIYEVIITSQGSQWMNSTQYDLLIHADRVKPSVNHLKLNFEKKETASQRFTLTNSSNEVSKISKIKISPAITMVSLKPFPLVANQISLKKIVLPKALKAVTTTDITVQVPNDSFYHSEFSGRVDHHLYRINPLTKLPEEAYTADSENSNSDKKVFKDVKLPKVDSLGDESELYVGFESFGSTLSGGDSKNKLNDFELEVLFSGIEVSDDLEIKLKVDEASSKEVFVLSLTASNKAPIKSNESSVAPRPFARSKMTLTFDNDTTISLPITLVK